MANFNKIIDTVINLKQEAQSSGSSGGEQTNRKWGIAFLPEGTHTVRILADAESEIFQYPACFHRLPKIGDANSTVRVPCADQVASATYLANCPICRELTAIDDFNKTADPTQKLNLPYGKLYREKLSKIFIYLVSTSAESDYWKPGNFYVVMGNKKMFDAVKAAVMMLVQAAQTSGDQSILNTFDYKCDNVEVFNLNVVRGAAGSVTAIPDSYNKPALNLTAKMSDSELPSIKSVYIDTVSTPNVTELERGAEEVRKFRASATIMRTEGGVVHAPQPTAAQVAQPQPAPVAQPIPAVAPQADQPPFDMTPQPVATPAPQPVVQQAPVAPVAPVAPQPQVAAAVPADKPACFGTFDPLKQECSVCPLDVKRECLMHMSATK